MQFVCDATEGKTWFRIETEAEASKESESMEHAVERYFRREWDKAVQTYKPTSQTFIERDIGLKAHVQRTMPIFLTLRDREGNPLATAMLPQGGRDDPNFRTIIVGRANGDPFASQDGAIAALGKHYGLSLDRDRCYPYKR
jgi:hypothetical protein